MSPDRPLLVYDDDCAFCRRALVWWRRLARGHVDDAPIHEAAARFPEAAPARFREAIHLRDPEGRWFRGAEAVYRGLAAVPGHGTWLRLYRRVPGFAPLSEWGYRRIARSRAPLERLISSLFGPPPGPGET